MSRYSKEIREMISQFTLMDDDFMTVVFHDNIPATQLVLRIILDRPDLIVEKVTTQERVKNLNGRSLTLDVLATDSNGVKYNIEVQNASAGASAQRARYHSSLLDAGMLPAGEDFRSLCETYVVFITRRDVLGAGKPLYHIERQILESGVQFGDGSHILYVNGSCHDDTPLGRLMQDFNCRDAMKFHYSQLAEQVQYLKETEGGSDRMCTLMEEFGKKVAMEARQEGRIESARNTATTLLKMGVNTLEQIATATELPLEDVRQIEKELKQ